MRDPREGVAPDGTIRTGVAIDRVPGRYRPVLDAAAGLVEREGASLYVYGSVATGQAMPPSSDVDLLTIDLPPDAAHAYSRSLSDEFADICRGVAIAGSRAVDFTGDHDQAYGGRVFLHHYCAHVAGPDRDQAEASFPADSRAARGFNGDIGVALERWRLDLGTREPAILGRQIGRKALFAVTGLVSVHDSTWTTDRQSSGERWGEVHPHLAEGLALLAAWAEDSTAADRLSIERALDEAVAPIVADFRDRIGLWPPDNP